MEPSARPIPSRCHLASCVLIGVLRLADGGGVGVTHEIDDRHMFVDTSYRGIAVVAGVYGFVLRAPRAGNRGDYPTLRDGSASEKTPREPRHGMNRREPRS